MMAFVRKVCVEKSLKLVRRVTVLRCTPVAGYQKPATSPDLFLVWDSIQQPARSLPPQSHYRNEWTGSPKKVSAPFCRTCNRAFATRGSLNRHMEMHRPLRVKHPCHLCIKEFAWPSDLTTHLRISHGSPQSRLGHRAPRLRMPPSAET